MATRPTLPPVGWGFITLYTLSYAGGSLLFLAPLLVSLALKVNALVGIDRAPEALALVRDRVAGRDGRQPVVRTAQRPNHLPARHAPTVDGGRSGGRHGRILVVATAPTVPVVLVGWCTAQLFFNALLAAQVAVLPDQVPTRSGASCPASWASACPSRRWRTYLVQTFNGSQLAMFLAPCLIGGVFVLVFAATLDDRHLGPGQAAWSLHEFAGTFYFNPRRSPDFAWAFASRFMFVLAYAFLATYQAYFLIDHLGSADDVPQQIFLGTLVQSPSSPSPLGRPAVGPAGSAQGFRVRCRPRLCRRDAPRRRARH